MLQQDSIPSSPAAVQEGDSVVVQHRPLTPAQVLSWLPRDATPAQQDSAIQSRFKPGEIHWSEHPDTLHLPGHPPGVDLMNAELPQYYREGYFSKDSMFHPEIQGGRIGVAGDPVPYRVHNDNVITSYVPREGRTDFSETSSELHFQVFLVCITCLLVALLFYFYTLQNIGETFVLRSQYTLITIYLGIVIVFFLLKMGLYTLANLVFFDGKRNQQWIRSLLFISSVEGVLLFPSVLIGGYLELDIEKVIVYVTIVLIFVKILTIYKCYVIFFRRNVVRLQIILYFCTLEIVPLLALWGVLVMTANNLKINF